MIKVIYQGNLRTQATHINSQNQLITDAPKDNHGKGEAFSPTDLVCSSLASCQMTMMGILAQREGINLEGLEAYIEKIMVDNPRRIGRIKITYNCPETLLLTVTEHEKLHRAAMTCPVGLSLHNDIVQEVEWETLHLKA
ncbi:OsmC family protein [Bernardetia sp. Wsw4-3y2]|uniref:OsmC family protein n=1 Tax=Bernardetia sp. Wsw4-3y2 TaxID=3127471 RepID=UPI0030D59D1B